MLFNSVVFLLFFPTVVVVDLLLQRRPTWRKGFLLAASYFFYAQWDPRFLFLIWTSTAVDWFVGNALQRSEEPRRRKHLLWFSLAVNLGLLGTFKYFDFFIESANALLESIGFQGNVETLRLILPVGISFYTFQTLSYTIEIYRRKLEPADSPLDFALFVGFFPQLVAGPIVRAKEFLPQVARNPRASRRDYAIGVYDILSGLFKKVVIADIIGTDLSEPFYGHPERWGFLGAMAGIYGFAFQLYGDFAGYSQMAIGCGRILGFRLPKNFDNPFMARNNLEIWRRWHITLLSWMRDYIYIPLGGSRGGSARTYRNIMITNLFSGVWHGAGINFVLWGIVNGVTICCSRMYQGWRARRGRAQRDDPFTVWRQRFVMFHVWLIAMPIFRTPDLATLAEVGRALTRWQSPHVPEPAEISQRGLFLVGLAFLMHVLSEYRGGAVRRAWVRLPAEAQGAIAICFFGLLSHLSTERTPFIYFQF